MRTLDAFKRKTKERKNLLELKPVVVDSSSGEKVTQLFEAEVDELKRCSAQERIV